MLPAEGKPPENMAWDDEDDEEEEEEEEEEAGVDEESGGAGGAGGGGKSDSDCVGCSDVGCWWSIRSMGAKETGCGRQLASSKNSPPEA